MDPVSELNRRQGIQPVTAQRLAGLHRSAQAQHRHEMSVHDTDRCVEDCLVVDAALDHEEERLYFLGAVFAIVALGAGFVAEAEAAEPSVYEQLGRRLLGNGDAGDKLRRRGEVDWCDLLDDGEPDDFVKRGFVDRSLVPSKFRPRSYNIAPS